MQLAGVLPQHHRVLLAGKEHALRASLDLALHEPALLPGSAAPWWRRWLRIGRCPYRVLELRDLGLRAGLFRPGFRDPKALAGGESLFVLQDPALGQAR